MKFSDLKHVYILGIGGTLMGNFAIMLKRKGVEVFGSDHALYPPMSDRLKEEKISVFEGYDACHLDQVDPQKGLVVIGNVISANNPEAQAVMEKKLPVCSLPEFLENYFLQKTHNLVVSGTHGKTTTAAILAFLLDRIGKNPNYFVGGVVPELEESFHVHQLPPEGYFVLEGDEYDTAYWDKVPKFFHYCPDHVILTSIEFDHADIYSDMDMIRRAFDGLIERIRPKGKLIYRGDDLEIRALVERNHSLLQKNQIDCFTFGKERRCDFQWRDVTHGDKTEFDFYYRDACLGRVEMHLSGEHNIHNALSVLALLVMNELPIKSALKALSEFHGIKRRQEVRGQVGEVVVIDDFAHHPTAVAETLKALRSKYPERELLVAFEPRSATSRRKVFQDKYAESFDPADEIYISVPYDQTRIDPEECFSSEALVRSLKARNKTAFLLKTGTSEKVNQLSLNSRGPSVLAVLSNGAFDGLIPAILDSD